ncbi:MAG: type II toxin-antitoxin system death-on-curing family toxin [Gammaproteobacteria bacterium]|nr:type II toxin-antitoxin system death-on-curing family toxin [Gammaproteobacteria bacterium]
MTEPKWLSRQMVLAIHAEAIWHFGGMSGVRDDKLLESALDRPRNLYCYDDSVDLFKLAASLCTGLIKNHPFNDGNKRTGLLAVRAFLFLNGQALEPDEADEVETMVAVADGRLDETDLAEWLKANCNPLD